VKTTLARLKLETVVLDTDGRIAESYGAMTFRKP